MKATTLPIKMMRKRLMSREEEELNSFIHNRFKYSRNNHVYAITVDKSRGIIFDSTVDIGDELLGLCKEYSNHEDEEETLLHLLFDAEDIINEVNRFKDYDESSSLIYFHNFDDVL